MISKWDIHSMARCCWFCHVNGDVIQICSALYCPLLTPNIFSGMPCVKDNFREVAIIIKCQKELFRQHVTVFLDRKHLCVPMEMEFWGYVGKTRYDSQGSILTVLKFILRLQYPNCASITLDLLARLLSYSSMIGRWPVSRTIIQWLDVVDSTVSLRKSFSVVLYKVQ